MSIRLNLLHIPVNHPYDPTMGEPLPNEPARRAWDSARVFFDREESLYEYAWDYLKKFLYLTGSFMILYLIWSVGLSINPGARNVVAYEIGYTIGLEIEPSLPTVAFIGCRDVLVDATELELTNCYEGVVQAFEERNWKVTAMSLTKA